MLRKRRPAKSLRHAVAALPNISTRNAAAWFPASGVTEPRADAKSKIKNLENGGAAEDALALALRGGYLTRGWGGVFTAGNPAGSFTNGPRYRRRLHRQG